QEQVVLLEKCKKCNSEIEKGWGFCPYCMEKLEVGVQEIVEVEPLRIAVSCPKCNGLLEPTWKTCPYCDVSLPTKVIEIEKPIEKVEEVLKCKNCNSEIEESWKICPYCDATLEKIEKEAGEKIYTGVVKEINREEVMEALKITNKVIEETRALGIDVKKAENLYLLAVSMLEAGKYEKAITYSSKARKIADDLRGLS
ncbi:MAG: zinc ribbon domain-containing protein, partial [Candidatus Thermoplasmatota archaeon]